MSPKAEAKPGTSRAMRWLSEIRENPVIAGVTVAAAALLAALTFAGNLREAWIKCCVPPPVQVPVLVPVPAPPPPVPKPLSCEYSRDVIHDEYARLFGAMQVPLFMSIQTFGGTTCGDEVCSLSGVARYASLAGDTEPHEPQSGHISKGVGEAWLKKWPYIEALPLMTPLWKQVEGDSGRGTLQQLDARLAPCINNLTTYDAPQAVCDQKLYDELNMKVGHLFWVFQNRSPNELKNVELTYDEIHGASDYVNRAGRYSIEVQRRSKPQRKTIALPNIASCQSHIALIAVYEREPSGFERKHLKDGMTPLKLRYRDAEGVHEHKIRLPRRDTIITIGIPHGWYAQ